MYNPHFYKLFDIIFMMGIFYCWLFLYFMEAWKSAKAKNNPWDVSGIAKKWMDCEKWSKYEYKRLFVVLSENPFFINSCTVSSIIVIHHFFPCFFSQQELLILTAEMRSTVMYGCETLTLTTKNMQVLKIYGKRSRRRYQDMLDEDFKKLRINNWRTVVENRKE